MIDLPPQADAAILGGGFAGLATARALARRGVQAVVLERESSLGRYASGRCAGLGRQLAEDDATTALTIRGAAALRELPGAWDPTGGVLGFDDAAAADSYAARAARFGLAAERIRGADVGARWPALAGAPVAEALFVPSDGAIVVPALFEALRSSANICLDAEVLRVEPGLVSTARGEVKAKIVVDATGAWAGAITGAAPPLDVYKRHLYVLEAQLPASPFFWHVGAREYYVRAADGGLLASPCDGSLGPPADVDADPSGAAALADRLAGTPWATAPVARAWACQRAFAPDRRMRLGRDPHHPWLVWAAALGGHGATAACAVGEVVADAVVDALSSGGGPST